MPEKKPTQQEAVEALKELDREQLKKLNKDQGLGVRVKSTSDDELRAAIAEAMEDEEPTEEESPEEAESGGIRSRLPGRESLPSVASPATLGLAAGVVALGAIGGLLWALRGRGGQEQPGPSD